MMFYYIKFKAACIVRNSFPSLGYQPGSSIMFTRFRFYTSWTTDIGANNIGYCDKKAELSQRCTRDAPYISVP